MGSLQVEVWDATGNKRQLAELPDDAPVNRVLAVLIERMGLPRNSPDGQLLSYKFHHKTSGRQLLDTETLASAGVKPGDVLRVQPEITAGGSASRGPSAGSGSPAGPPRAEPRGGGRHERRPAAA